MPSTTLIRCGSFAESVSAAIDGRADVVIGVRQFFDDLELVVGDDTVMTVDQAIGVNLAIDRDLASQVMSFIRAAA
jgi:hypothetical protein